MTQRTRFERIGMRVFALKPVGGTDLVYGAISRTDGGFDVYAYDGGGRELKFTRPNRAETVRSLDNIAEAMNEMIASRV